jgi:hypothetical protein
VPLRRRARRGRDVTGSIYYYTTILLLHHGLGLGDAAGRALIARGRGQGGMGRGHDALRVGCEGRRAGWRIGGFVWPEASRLGPRSAFGIGRDGQRSG